MSVDLSSSAAIILAEHLSGADAAEYIGCGICYYVKSCNIRRLQKCIRERAVPARATRLSPAASGIAYPYHMYRVHVRIVSFAYSPAWGEHFFPSVSGIFNVTM